MNTSIDSNKVKVKLDTKFFKKIDFFNVAEIKHKLIVHNLRGTYKCTL